MKRTIKQVNLPFEESLPLYFTGPDLSEGSAPALFYFCTAGMQTLTESPFCDLLDHFPTSLRIFSLSLPFHEEGISNRHSLRDHWGLAFQENPQFLEQFFSKFKAIFRYLQNQEYLSPNRIAVAGISRGGFIATNLAARHPEINHLLAFAPMTDLNGSPYFNDLPQSAYTYNASNLIEKLEKTKTFFLIGNCDIAVSTEACISFISKLISHQSSQGQRSPETLFKLRPSIGHRGHGSSPETFKEGALWLCKMLAL